MVRAACVLLYLPSLSMCQADFSELTMEPNLPTMDFTVPLIVAGPGLFPGRVAGIPKIL